MPTGRHTLISTTFQYPRPSTTSAAFFMDAMAAAYVGLGRASHKGLSVLLALVFFDGRVKDLRGCGGS